MSMSISCIKGRPLFFMSAGTVFLTEKEKDVDQAFKRVIDGIPEGVRPMNWSPVYPDLVGQEICLNNWDRFLTPIQGTEAARPIKFYVKEEGGIQSYFLTPDAPPFYRGIYKNSEAIPLGEGAFFNVFKLESVNATVSPLAWGKCKFFWNQNLCDRIEAFMDESKSRNLLSYTFIQRPSQKHRPLFKMNRVSELMQGDCSRIRIIEKSVVLRYFQDIADTLHYIEQVGWIHRNIKPSNIFISFSGELKIGDFDLVKRHKDAEVSEFINSEYYPPEFKGWGGILDPRKIDVYSAGFTFLKILSQTKGVFSEEAITRMKNICNESRNICRDQTITGSQKYTDLGKVIRRNKRRDDDPLMKIACRMLDPNPVLRVSIENVSLFLKEK